MWQLIRQGVRWRPRERYALAMRGLDLAKVKSVKISFDPFYEDNAAIRYCVRSCLNNLFNFRYFWKTLGMPKVRMTNPKIKITYDIRNDRSPPFFDAEIGKLIIY